MRFGTCRVSISEYPAKDGAATPPFCFQAKQFPRHQIHFLLSNGLTAVYTSILESPLLCGFVLNEYT